MPTKIKPDYTPNDRVYELMSNRYGELSIEQAREFIGHELPEFIMYWEERGKPMEVWDSVCLRRMKTLYEDKKDYMAQNRSYSGPQGNIFDKVLDKLGANPSETPAPPSSPVQAYVHPVQPQPTETMSASDALDELSKLRRRLSA